MHVLLEGVVPVKLECILHDLCYVDKRVTLQKVNEDLLLLWGKIPMDKTHKPAEITEIHEPGHFIVPSMKPVKYWAFLEYLPLALGWLIPPENERREFLLHLSHLVDLVFARKFTVEMTKNLTIVISIHLSELRRL